MKRNLFRGVLLALGLLWAGASATAQTPVFKDGKYNPPLTLTFEIVQGAGTKFKPGEDYNNNVMSRWALENFGIKFQVAWTAPTGEALTNKLRLMLASGEAFPDVMRVNDVNVTKDLIESKKAKDITDEFNKYATPRLKEIYTKYPEALYQVKKNGRMYGLPVLTSGNVSDELMWIRQDWLDKVGMKAPTTIAELEKVMDAFMTKDPGGNGKGKTLGVSIGAKNALATWMSSTGFLIGSFGGVMAHDNGWGLAADGKTLAYKAIQPEMKKVLAKLNEWKNKGYIDPQFALMDESKASESFVQGKSGIIFGPPWMIEWPFGDLKKLNPDAQPKPFPVPAGADGSRGRFGEGMTQGTTIFSPDFKGVEGYLKMLDRWYGSHVAYGDAEFQYGMFEGYDYQMVDGKPVIDSTNFIDPSMYFPGLENYPSIAFIEYNIYEYLWQGGKPRNLAEKTLLAKTAPEKLQGGAIINSQNKYNMPNLFSGAPTATMSKKGEYLRKLEQDTFAQIIYGSKPVAYFDEFVKQWKANGGDAVTKEANDWYKSVSAK